MNGIDPAWIVPAWPAPPRVRAFVTTRAGGVSNGPYASMNLGMKSGDAVQSVQANRAILRRCLPAEPAWLAQVHGAAVVEAGSAPAGVEADASWTACAGAVCAVLVADCMPVFLCARDGGAVGIAHAGWRGLSGGVIEATVRAMNVAPSRLLAWLGPAIGPRNFEVGDDVLQAFTAHDARAGAAFAPYPGRPGKWLCDLYALARSRRADLGVTAVGGGNFCTVRDARLFSHRRDHGRSGRMAALIWIDA